MMDRDEDHLLVLSSMPQLAEAMDEEDDWTGITDAAARRKRQNRLNVRAHRRRRKALQEQEQGLSNSPNQETLVSSKQTEIQVACWVEDQQAVLFFPSSIANTLHNFQKPLVPISWKYSHLPSINSLSTANIMFPISSDHLIPLLQFNVLRATLTNRLLISSIRPLVAGDCSSVAQHILPIPNDLVSIPPSLQPTYLQSTIPHEDWVDNIPHPRLRDNVLLALGSFDEDAVWSDTIGGMFEGFPASEIQRRGVIVWNPAWDISGWEISEGFFLRWMFMFKGCEDALEATNRWRALRGEAPLDYKRLLADL